MYVCLFWRVSGSLLAYHCGERGLGCVCEGGGLFWRFSRSLLQEFVDAFDRERAQCVSVGEEVPFGV